MSNTSTTPQSIAISIIIPVYNVEPFVGDCLHSILVQTFSEPFEILLIDDCSSDQSRAICRQFRELHPQRVELIESPLNEGVSAARNRGLEIMRGRYFMFVDPDDLLPPDTLELLYNAAEQSNASIIKGNNTIFSESSEKSARYNVERKTMIHGADVLTVLYQHEKVRGHAGGKLFRRDLLGQYRFPVGISMVEDLFYCSETFAHADSLLLLNHPVYRYRYRESGATGLKYENGSYIDWLDTVEKSVQFASNEKQIRAHKTLLVRTLTQLARECRKLPLALAQVVLPVIEQRQAMWDIKLWSLIVRDRLGLRTISHYLKMSLAMRDIRRNLAHRED